MKKIMLVLVIILSGCRCMLGQIPPQYIYAGTGCTASLPDYKTILIISDNCEIANVSQLPSPGYLLDASNKIVNVTLRTEDASGNFRQVTFSVALLDTIKPVITIDSSLLGYNTVKMTEFYDLADNYVGKLFDSAYTEKKWLFVISHKDSAGFRERLITYKDTLRFPVP